MGVVNELPKETDLALKVGDEIIDRTETRVTSWTPLGPSSGEVVPWLDLDASGEVQRRSAA